MIWGCVRKKDLLVFQCSRITSCEGCEDNGSELINWVWLSPRIIDDLFSVESKLQNVFKHFIRKGYIGLVWYAGDKWLSYAWMKVPTVLGPPHLPRHIQQLPVYWIFYCRTKEEYRGRGLYKASLRILCNWARDRDPKVEIYIDTEPSNVPSRKAIEAIGFVPAGIISVWTLGLPKLGSVAIWGSWNKEAKHPGVDV